MFEKLHARFQNVFRPQENETPAFGNSSGLKKPTFCNGLKRTEGLIGETLLCFQVRTGPCLTIIHIQISVLYTHWYLQCLFCLHMCHGTSNIKRQQFCLCPLLTVFVFEFNVVGVARRLCAIVNFTLFFKNDIYSPTLFHASENGWHVQIP